MTFKTGVALDYKVETLREVKKPYRLFIRKMPSWQWVDVGDFYTQAQAVQQGEELQATAEALHTPEDY